MCIFRGTYWLGQIAGQFFLFCCSENGKCVFCLIINFSGICICQSDEKAGIGIFIFAVPSSVNIFNSGTVQVNVSVRTGESEDKVMVPVGL
mgnify:CR=1 FL=1